MKKFVVVTVIGVFFGLVTGVLYGISMQDFLGAIGMFFGMIAFFYVAAFGV